MPRCQVCKLGNEALWAWQPFGPSDDWTAAFVTLGSHYRGFPVVKVCDACRQMIKTQPIFFAYKKTTYGTNPETGDLKAAPF